MAPTPGKRKYLDELIEEYGGIGNNANDQTNDKLRDRVRQYFETAFEPLEEIQPQLKHANDGEAGNPSSEIESDWSGFSEDEDDGAEVIVCRPSWRTSKADISSEELKTFMTTKPPTSGQKPEASTAKRKDHDPADPDEARTDAANLKKDLALQRLLKESHLLDSQSSSLSHSGRNRHKALDLRLQDMGSKSSIFTQQKMPLAERKGIKAKAAEREGARRRSAQENGIVLEKAVRGKKKDGGKRERGIGAPSVGRFQGGMLKLSKKDVAEIEGPRRSSRRRK